ncbi:RecX family transcriptional regulator [Roseomonas xinghualingensis]|uniref:RecX family transcriptional regulator n=1 Tax=Roseomonas xinghualingensis TaxID=2986475 RepID=UPI0021F0D31B|nr:RecX family transcriptional regulator [Roseomonas sp. SXEYE001]MCV4206476.1 RecX family transcriptional regulator [Roseomonas sp. SXEYE001]
MADDKPSPSRRRPPRERRAPTAGPAPTEARLYEAALNHLARFAATEAGLTRVLQRRVARWAQRAEREGMAPETIAPIVAQGRAAALTVARRMVTAGAVDDAAFAASRARRLARAGRSRRAIAAHLAAKGVGGDMASETLEEAGTDEVVAALAHLRRRRQGPFDPNPPEEAEAARTARMKAMAALARAGFPRDVAETALDFDPAEAEARIIESRRG